MRALGLTLVGMSLLANPVKLQFQEIAVMHEHKNGFEKVVIKRKKDGECLNVNMSPETIYGGNMAKSDIPEACKKTFVTSVGKIQPLELGHGVKTVGEIEVLDFIENKMNKNPQGYLLIDSRRPNWYEVSTIPGAVNIPYDEMSFDEHLKEDYARMLKHLGVVQHNEFEYDFSKAKTVLLFCNGHWCGQSPMAIVILLEMGYPSEKILWYRGGMQDWIGSGFNVIKPK